MKKLKQKIFSGRVVSGEKIGRTIGFPTANFDKIPSEDELDMGVYSGVCEVLGEEYNCMVYFGPRLIFNEVLNVFEVFIIDFSAKIYGEKINVIVHEYIRGPIKFTSIDHLHNQLSSDLIKVEEAHARTS